MMGGEHAAGGCDPGERVCREEERVGREPPGEECPARRVALEAQCHLGARPRATPNPGPPHRSRYRRESGNRRRRLGTREAGRRHRPRGCWGRRRCRGTRRCAACSRLPSERVLTMGSNAPAKARGLRRGTSASSARGAGEEGPEPRRARRRPPPHIGRWTTGSVGEDAPGWRSPIAGPDHEAALDHHERLHPEEGPGPHRTRSAILPGSMDPT